MITPKASRKLLEYKGKTFAAKEEDIAIISRIVGGVSYIDICIEYSIKQSALTNRIGRLCAKMRAAFDLDMPSNICFLCRIAYATGISTL